MFIAAKNPWKVEAVNALVCYFNWMRFHGVAEALVVGVYCAVFKFGVAVRVRSIFGVSVINDVIRVPPENESCVKEVGSFFNGHHIIFNLYASVVKNPEFTNTGAVPAEIPVGVPHGAVVGGHSWFSGSFARSFTRLCGAVPH